MSPIQPIVVPEIATPHRSSRPHAAARCRPHNHAATAVLARLEMARALGLSGADAMFYLTGTEPSPRPMVTALLDQLDIQGMAN